MICILRHAHFMIFHEPAGCQELSKEEDSAVQANWVERQSFLKIPIRLIHFLSFFKVSLKVE